MQQVSVTLALSDIRTDGGTQPRTSLDLMYVAELAQAIEYNATIPPITVFYDGTEYWLADGFHRYNAAQQLDRANIQVDIRQGTRRDAILFSVGANAQHGLRRTNNDKRKAVETLLNDSEWSIWSNREIARQCGVTSTFVDNLRKETTANGLQSDIRKGSDGRIYNTANIGHSQIQEPTQTLMRTTELDNTFPGWHLTKPEKGGFLAEFSTKEVETFDGLKQALREEEVDFEDEEEKPELTEEDRYQLAVDTGTTDYYYSDLRREAFERDREQREETTTTKSTTLTALQSSESNEWYTPASYVDAARELMGDIDVDPASCELANQAVKAARYYTKEDNGLVQSWQGRVWLNPPYGVDSGMSNQEAWSHQLMERYEAGLVSEAVLLVNANTEAKWFQPLYRYLICLTNHRIRFYNADGTPSQPTQGNALIYFGKQKRRFIEIFERFGEVVRRANADEF